MTVRLDNKKYFIPIEIYNGNYAAKENKFVNVKVKLPDDIIKISSCALPDFYNDIILIKSIIDDIKDVDASKRFEYVNTER